MNTEEIRKLNFLKICEEHGRSVVAERLGYWDVNYVNQLCSGACNIGPRTTKKIEKVFNMGAGSLSIPHVLSSQLQLRLALASPELAVKIIKILDVLLPQTVESNT